MENVFRLLVLTVIQLLFAITPSISAEVNDKHSIPAQFIKNPQVEKGYNWLRCRQDSKSHLIFSYDMPGDKTTWTYDQAIAIMAFLAVGDVSTAQLCADSMLKIRDEEFNVWADSYNVCTSEVLAKPMAVGPNAWMGMALLQLYEVTKKQKYLSASEYIGNFVLLMQSQTGPAKGSVSGGYDENRDLFPWTSTEHNVDSVAFLITLAEHTNNKSYQTAAIEIVTWLDRAMWDKELKCYYPGYEDNRKALLSHFPERLDSQTWSILALKAAAKHAGWPKEIAVLLHNGLSWIDQYQCEVTYENNKISGFSKITLSENENKHATPGFWAEGTAGYLLAARLMEHDNTDLETILKSLRRFQKTDGSVPYSVGISYPDVLKQFQPSDLIIADFESHPNRLWGQVGVYGDGEPDWDSIKKEDRRVPYSWYYDKKIPNYNTNYVHSGCQSFRLVNAGKMCKSKTKGWASFGLDLGPLGKCNKIEPVDVSNYEKLIFWAKTDNPNRASLKVLFRDTHARGYMPQVSILPKPSKLTENWQRFTVDLKRIEKDVDLSALVHIGFAFGEDIGNQPDTVIYLDDIGFTGSTGRTNISNGNQMPPVYPQHWPFGSVAATAWLIFVELDINPFGGYKAPRISPLTQCLCPPDKHHCEDRDILCNLFDHISFSANLDTSYRRTQFYKKDDNAVVFQGDSRLDFWMPPYRDEFSWSPYIRLAGVTSSRDYDWENNWGAHPGIGVQVYPFSWRTLKEESKIYHDISRILGPLHLFAEHNQVRFIDREEDWMAKDYEQVRIGADIWKEWHVNDIENPWWAETWHGLLWFCSNEWDIYNHNTVFANTLRVGVRQPKAGVLSMLTPYLAAESSLTEKDSNFWENRLLLGGGIRFAPPLKFMPKEWNVTRLVIYAEYMDVTAYYRGQPGSGDLHSDYDFRFGININIGEWWYKK